MGPWGPGLRRAGRPGAAEWNSWERKSRQKLWGAEGREPQHRYGLGPRGQAGRGRCDLCGPPLSAWVWGSGPAQQPDRQQAPRSRASRGGPGCSSSWSHGWKGDRMLRVTRNQRVMGIWMGRSGSELSFITHIAQWSRAQTPSLLSRYEQGGEGLDLGFLASATCPPWQAHCTGS